MEMVFDLATIEAAAQQFWQHFGMQAVFAFHGPMGVGKTTFIRALCADKVPEDTVASPTFSIINDYLLEDGEGRWSHLYHMDLYRIRDEEEAVRAGVEEALYSGSACLVEWPEKAAALLPADTIHVQLSVLPDRRRLLKASLPGG